MAHPLTTFREKRGETLEVFAQSLGASKGMLWKWENGKAIPRPEYMRKIIDLSKGAAVMAFSLKVSPEAAVLPWNPGPYQEAPPHCA